jgi:hypothetical protein
MNPLVHKYFEGQTEVEEFRFLSDEANTQWSELEKSAPDLPRGWFELSRIRPHDRIDFVSSLWLENLPYRPAAHDALSDFFDRLDDVGVVLTREGVEAWSPELVYSLEDDSCFFRGLLPCTEPDLGEMRQEIGALLPKDYIAFLKMHNGFGKISEMGLLKASEIGDARRRLMQIIRNDERLLKSSQGIVEPGSLIPFFEVLGLNSFQCFDSDWYPENEMGNVYFSGIDYTLSERSDRQKWADNLAFPTFSDWLANYVEGMNLSP